MTYQVDLWLHRDGKTHTYPQGYIEASLQEILDRFEPITRHLVDHGFRTGLSVERQP